MDFESEFKPFCSSSSLINDEDAYSPITCIQEKNPNVMVRSINVEEDDICFPTIATSVIISAWLNIFYYQKKHTFRTVEESLEIINEAISCANLMYFKTITRKKSEVIRNSCTSILSTSLGTYDVIHFTDDHNDDNDSISSVIVDGDFIEREIKDIVNNINLNTTPVTIESFLDEFKSCGISKKHPIKKFDVIIDNKFCDIKKKILILCGIFRNNESEISSLLEMRMYIEGLDQHYAESQLYEMRSIHKSIWHLFYAMDTDFLIMMLLWIESSYNKNPHDIIINARPLFVYLRECITRNEPKEYYISKKITPKIEDVKDQVKLTRTRNNNGEALDELIRIIDVASEIKSCDECSKYMKYILSNSDGVDSVHVPAIDTMECLLCEKLGGIKRQIHNLNKTTKKKFNSGESKKASSVPPIFKQILSLAGTTCNLIYHQENAPDDKKIKKPYDDMYETTKELIDLRTFTNAFENKESVMIVSDKQLTMLPLDFHDILSCTKYRSFIIEFNNQISNKTVLSIHKVYIKEKKKNGYIIIDLYQKNDNNPNAIGISAFCDDISDVIKYFRTSIYSNKKFMATIQIFKFSKQQRSDMMIRLQDIIK